MASYLPPGFLPLGFFPTGFLGGEGASTPPVAPLVLDATGLCQSLLTVAGNAPATEKEDN